MLGPNPSSASVADGCRSDAKQNESAPADSPCIHEALAFFAAGPSSPGSGSRESMIPASFASAHSASGTVFPHSSRFSSTAFQLILG